jgi:hypothetical protein
MSRGMNDRIIVETLATQGRPDHDWEERSYKVYPSEFNEKQEIRPLVQKIKKFFRKRDK